VRWMLNPGHCWKNSAANMFDKSRRGKTVRSSDDRSID